MNTHTIDSYLESDAAFGGMFKNDEQTSLLFTVETLLIAVAKAARDGDKVVMKGNDGQLITIIDGAVEPKKVYIRCERMQVQRLDDSLRDIAPAFVPALHDAVVYRSLDEAKAGLWWEDEVHSLDIT